MGPIIVFHAGVEMMDCPHRRLNILISALENGTTEYSIKSARRLFKACEVEYVMLDSGGNNIFKKESKGEKVTHDPNMPMQLRPKLNIAPVHLVETAQKFRPSVLVALDVPLQRIEDQREQEADFFRKLPVNIAFAKETIDLVRQKCPEVHVLVPIQAKTMDQFELFLKKLNGLAFSGVAIPSRNISPETLVLFLARLYELKIEWVHILGTTSFTNSGIAAYFARQNYIRIVSLDSKSWKDSGIHDNWLSPHDLRSHNISDETQIPEESRNDCRCPFCRGLSFQEMAHVMTRYDRRDFLYTHNAWVTESVIEELFKNARSLDQLRQFMTFKSRRDTKVLAGIDALYVFEALRRKPSNYMKLLLE